MVFRLYNAESAGTLLGTPLTQTVTLVNGLFTTRLDFGQSVFTGEARWLEIEVAGITLTPRQALTPAPMALALPGFYTQQTAGTPNLIGGWSGNSVTPAVVGATISGGGVIGLVNRVTDNYGIIGGGANNQAGDNAGTTGDRPHATVGGGYLNIASGLRSTVGGGYRNAASGDYAMVGGGYQNTAAGDFSFAAGRQAKANHPGAFVWGDSTFANIASTGDNQFIVRASGGIWLGTTSTPEIPAGRFLNTSTGAFLSSGGTWTNASDRNVKANIAAINPRSILEALAALPIARWNYTSQDASVQHIGPMAQDFYAAFGVGEGETTISTVDADGVALASIQGLYQLLQEKDAEMEVLRGEVAALKAAAPGGSPALPAWLLALATVTLLALLGVALLGMLVLARRLRRQEAL